MVEINLRRQREYMSEDPPEMPVTIRHPSTRIVARGLTGRQINLSDGQYIVSVDLPDGSALVDHIKVDESTNIVTLNANEAELRVAYSKVVERLSEPDDKVPISNSGPIPKVARNPRAGPMFDVGSSSAAASAETEDYSFKYDTINQEAAAFARQRHEIDAFVFPEISAASSTKRKYSASELISDTFGKMYRGPKIWQLSRSSSELPTVVVEGNNDAKRYVLFSSNTHDYIQSPIAVAIPAAANSSVEYTLTRSAKNRVIPVLMNTRANSLLSYLSEQSYSNIEAFADPDIAKGFQDLLYSKITDPVGAAIGGYGLLSINHYNPLKHWSKNLTSVASWMPDGFAIHGETQARLGNHQKALQSFLSMTKVGLPIFSTGLSFAEMRMRAYSRQRNQSEAVRKEINTWLDAISKNVIPKLVLGQMLTTIGDPEITEIG